MTRLRSIPAALAAVAALGAGAAGATTIISGSNSVRIHQSPLGTAFVAQSPVESSELRVMRPAPVELSLHRVDEPVIATRNEHGANRLLMFWNPWLDGFHRSAPRAPLVIEDDCEGDYVPSRTLRSLHAAPAENRAVDMMRTIMRRLDM